jgi:hypothetical protein
MIGKLTLRFVLYVEICVDVMMFRTNSIPEKPGKWLIGT